MFNELYWPELKNTTTSWLISPDPTAQQLLIAWTQQEQPALLFLVNLGTASAAVNTSLLDANLPADWQLEGLFSSQQTAFEETARWNNTSITTSELADGECRVYKIVELAVG